MVNMKIALDCDCITTGYTNEKLQSFPCEGIEFCKVAKISICRKIQRLKIIAKYIIQNRECTPLTLGM